MRGVGMAFFERNYTADYNDIFAVQRASRLYHYSARQRFIALLVMVPYMALVAWLAVYSDDWVNALARVVGSGVAWLIPLVGLIIVYFVFVRVVCYWAIPKLSARWMEQRRPASAQAFTADDTGMRWDSPQNGLWLKWPGVERIFLTPMALCFLSGGMTYYIPRRAFSGPAEMKSFLAAALQKVPAEARAKSEADATVKAILAVTAA
jgi:hypothetical protein